MEHGRNAQRASFASVEISDSHIDSKRSETYGGTNARPGAHMQEQCYRRSYTSETAQGSVWKWVKGTLPCDAANQSREEGGGEAQRNDIINGN